MSYSNVIFGKELYFENETIFKKAYTQIENQCDEIIKDKFFSSVNVSFNKNKCYIFAATMIYRQDEKSFLGKATKNGLVQGTGKRYFYVNNLYEDWLENKTKIGIIKGNGSFSYNSRSGENIIPKGTVVFLK